MLLWWIFIMWFNAFALYLNIEAGNTSFVYISAFALGLSVVMTVVTAASGDY